MSDVTVAGMVYVTYIQILLREEFHQLSNFFLSSIESDLDKSRTSPFVREASNPLRVISAWIPLTYNPRRPSRVTDERAQATDTELLTRHSNRGEGEFHLTLLLGLDPGKFGKL